MARFAGNDPDWDKDDDDDGLDDEGRDSKGDLVAPKRKKVPKQLPQIIEKRCKCCTSPFRNIIDRMLVIGLSYKTIADEFEHEGISRQNITNHHKKHITYQDRAIREILEEEARRVVENVDEVKTSLVTSRGFMQTMLMKSYQMMLDNSLKMEARDVIQMINLMEKMNEDSATVEKEELMREFNLFVRAVKTIIPQDMWNLIVYELDRLKSQEDSLISADLVTTHELPSASVTELEEDDTV